MKLLIVTHNFPPMENPRAFRWGALTKYWTELGYDIDVIAGSQCTTNRTDISPNLRIHGVGLSLRPSRVHVVTGDAPTIGAIPPSSPESRVKLATDTAFGLLKSTWKKICWPDYACGWYPFAIRRARTLLRQTNYDALITVSHPYTPHLVGCVLSKQHSDLRWLADIGDPFSTPSASPLNNQRLYSNKNTQLEGDVFRRADCVSVTTAETKAEYAASFPEAAAKTHVVPPMLSFPDGHHDVLPRSAGASRKLVFAGTLHHPIRTPVGLLRMFRRLIAQSEFSDLQLHFYGRTDECRHDFDSYEDLIGEKIFLHGIQPRQLVWPELLRAHMLVNIGNSTSTQLPSKLVEYISTGRPILNLTTQNSDSSRQGLSEYPAALNFNTENIQDDESAIAALCRFVANPPQVPSHTIQRLTAPFQVDVIARQYEELLSGTAESRQRAA